jgi:adenosylcobinamide-phosphate synthase
MGRTAGFLEEIFYGISNGFLSGILFNIITIFLIVSFFAGLSFITLNISPLLFYPFSIYILFSFLSTGGLRRESIKIYGMLKADDIGGARKNLLSLAGRDSDNLNESEISRAVIESVAENTGDGIGSVIFYFTVGLLSGLFIFDHFFTNCYSAAPIIELSVIFGIIAAAVYKSANLLDSMVGYRNKKYKRFGKFSARLDDVLNYIPFRITAYFMLLSVVILGITGRGSNYHIKDVFKSWNKFRKSHPSPNAGQLESVMAGALKVKLGGINYYGGKISKRPIIGFEYYGRTDKEDILKALRIMELTSVIILIFCISVLILIKYRL